MASSNTKRRVDFDGSIAFRCPAELAQTVEAAAERELITLSDYARRAVLKSLKADGFKLQGSGTAA